jgi:hypothetical protein
MSFFVTDVESDGQIIGKHSIVCFGVVKLTPALDITFYGQMKPISDEYVPETLAVSGFSREEHLKFDDPFIVMDNFANWLKEYSVGRPVFISDNNGYDASWINYYFHVYYGKNPFGWSSRRIGDLYCGMVKDTFAQWKHLRKTEHTHNPVDDAMGNAEALLRMKEMGLKINTK